MTLTRQHFNLIAETLRTAPTTEENDIFGNTITTRERLAAHFAETLRTTNPNFDRERFIAAATKTKD